MKVHRKPYRRLQELILPQELRRGVIYVPSQFVVPVAYRGASCLFNTLTGQMIEADLPASAGAGEDADELIEARFLVPEDLDESAFYCFAFSLMQMAKPGSDRICFTILPTLACNARCVYCYEEGMRQTSMTEETEAQMLRYILSARGAKRVHLAWFGGEPLLRTDVIDRTCRRLRESEVSFLSTMVSNGSLITPEVIEKMTGLWKLRSIQISMDGAEEDYRERKRYYSYDNTYHRVIEAADRLAGALIRVSLRCNVDEGNIDRIPRFVEDLRSGIRNRDQVSVYLAPLNAVRESENAIPILEKICQAKRMIEDAGFRPSGGGPVKRGFRTGHCMADEGSVVIAPDGSLYACEHCPPASRFGDVWNGITDEEARKAFCRMDVVRQQCRPCPYLPLCTAFRSCPVSDRDCRNVMRRAVEELFSGPSRRDDPMSP